MSRALRVTLGILAGLGLLVLASSFFVSRTLNEWFERDLAARADLAVAGARPGGAGPTRFDASCAAGCTSLSSCRSSATCAI
jgi:hypothetical protein